MVDCPSCGHNNIEGSDHCDQCQADLSNIGLPDSSSQGLAQRLIEDSIMELKPELNLIVDPDTPVSEVAHIMLEQNASAVMVVSDQALVGIFTERDFLMKMADRYEEVADKPICEFMTPEPEALQTTDSIALGLNRMAVKSIRHIPILKDHKPVAMVRTRDILSFLTQHCQPTD